MASSKGSGNEGLPADLGWSTATAQAAGVGYDLVSQVCTVFVPQDKAVREYAASCGPNAAGRAAGPAGQLAVLAHSVLGQALLSSDVPEGGEVVLSNAVGGQLRITRSGAHLEVEVGGVKASVVRTDVQCGQAVMHVVDKILVPMT